MAAVIDQAAKQRILNHMNADHRLDLGLYLRHVNGLSPAQVAAEGLPEMLDMDLQSITVRTATSGRVHTVALTPPMATFGECRTRLVALSLEARAALDLNVTFRPPAGTDILVFGSVVFYFTCAALVFSGRDDTAARTWSSVLTTLGVPPPPSADAAAATASALSRAIGGPDGFRWLVRTIFLPVLAIHFSEMWWLDRSRLAPHGMLRGSRDWCLWVGSGFFEGAPSFRRFDRAVKADKAKAAEAARQEKR